jgi:hypothetical protein
LLAIFDLSIEACSLKKNTNQQGYNKENVRIEMATTNVTQQKWMKNNNTSMMSLGSQGKYQLGPTHEKLKIVYWNCRGYPWRRGPRLGPIVEGRDIICPVETHEHAGYKSPTFEGYTKFTIWNEVAGNGKGYGGILVLIKEAWGRNIQLEKMDPNN